MHMRRATNARQIKVKGFGEEKGSAQPLFIPIFLFYSLFMLRTPVENEKSLVWHLLTSRTDKKTGPGVKLGGAAVAE